MTNSHVNKDLIRELSELLEETGLSEIEWEEDGKRVRVVRQMGAAPVAAPVAAAAAASAPQDPATDPAGHPGAVNSPMVGTAYLAPEPGAAPFIKNGDKVTEGQTILIIEAMKTMNPIAAPRAGRVVQIFVANGDPVEYGEALLIIE
jgi:acetyl-CoA carboxylase biotin carboxyl carrier protein